MLQVASPGTKLSPGMKTKTVLARVQNQAGGKSPAVKTVSKKLSNWKDRKYTSTVQEPPKLEKWQIKEEEPARPTRFEWGDPDEFDPFFGTTSLTNHALMEKQKEKHSSVSAVTTPTPATRKAEDIFDSVKSQQQTESVAAKRPRPSEEESPSSSNASAEPPSKILKIEAQTSPIKTLENVESADNEAIEDVSTDAFTETEIMAESGSLDSLNEEIILPNSVPTLTLNENKIAEKKPVPILKPAIKSPAAAKTPQKVENNLVVSRSTCR